MKQDNERDILIEMTKQLLDDCQDVSVIYLVRQLLLDVELKK